MNRTSRLTSLVYLRRTRAGRGETLMIHKARGRQRGKWNGLGGSFEPGETPEACARREAREESGLELGALELRGFLTFPRFHAGADGEGGDAADVYAFVFTCRDFRGEPRASSEGELAWIPDDELLDLELYPGDRVFLPWLTRPGIFSAVLRYEGGEFRGYDVTTYHDLPPGTV